MRRSARWPLACLVLLLFAVMVGGCDDSRVDPNEVITITGQVHAPGGGPVSGQRVLLGTNINRGAFMRLTRGVACTGRTCGRNIREATTGADGRYTFTLRGRDTQRGWGETAPVVVSAAGSPGPSQVSGPVVWADFRVQAATVELPALELVEPDLTVEPSEGVTARWTPHKPGPYELVFEQADATPVWLVRTGEPAASVDPRVLEDTTGGVVVSGGSEEPILVLLTNRRRARLLFATAAAHRTFARRDELPADEREPYSEVWRPTLEALWAYAAGDHTEFYAISAALGRFYLSPQNHNEGPDGPQGADADEVAATYYAANCALHSLTEFALLGR